MFATFVLIKKGMIRMNIDQELDGWSKMFNDNFRKKQEVNNKLSPNLIVIKSIKDYSRDIADRITYIDLVSQMAHEGVINFDKAQEIINNQKECILDVIEHLKAYLVGKGSDE